MRGWSRKAYRSPLATKYTVFILLAQITLRFTSSDEEQRTMSAETTRHRTDSFYRIEDEPLLRGNGQFIDDIRIPNVLHVSFVRSQHGHARVLNIDADERVSPELALEIQSALQEDIQGFSFPRKTYYLGKWIQHGGWYPTVP